MSVLPVWTQVESKRTLASHLSGQFEAVVIGNKLTFVRTLPSPKFSVRKPQLSKNWKSELNNFCESPWNMGERGLSCSAMKIGLVTRSVQPPCIGLEQINERNPSISASLVIKKKKTGIEALIQCLVLVLENPFDVMPCINPLSIVRYTMGDKSLSDHLFRLRPVKYTLYPNV